MDIEEVREVMSGEIHIEKVHQAVPAHYEDLTEDQKRAARRFFKAMNMDKSGNICVDEFTTFLSHAGFQSDNQDCLFEELDKDQSGTLDFKELVTFFYILSCDDYKHLMTSGASTDVPRRRAKFGGRTEGAQNHGQRWNWSEISELYRKLESAYMLAEWANENVCNILSEIYEHRHQL